MSVSGKDINKARTLLAKGELVAIPTETVYGLAANATDPVAVAKIFEAKQRPHFDPLIVHVPDITTAHRYVVNIPPIAYTLTERFWPGPLTLVLQKKDVIPDIVTSGLDTVGIRNPAHSMTTELLRSIDFPLAAPSANPFGYVSPTTAKHVADQLGDKIPYILDGGTCNIGLESTIVGFEDGLPVVYRMGGLSLESIREVTGELQVRAHSTSNPVAPGQLRSHYAPRVKIRVGDIEALARDYAGARTGVLSFKNDFGLPNQIILSKAGSMEEAAHHLFSALRQFDSMQVDVVLAEWVPEQGLGRAINDRLRRASASDDPL